MVSAVMTRTVRLDRPGGANDEPRGGGFGGSMRCSAQLAQLQTIQSLLEQATEVVLGGGSRAPGSLWTSAARHRW